ncbi:FecCD family ABC transporter permease [Microbacterium oleivorans]|uniref:ABC-type Fe3+-siderophore transport system, permease component n=1 Tax=Microbacterium oleivorans TaxID=273677 RepID=A0A031FUV3_9MICO|nr:iron chelate uptake ABC transporter family permease subunit [Microbacterium oleivorans]AZS43182.1 Ferric enterobactin transport system permease protein FepD [Microbacterium oleivorans]EZP27981.1 ABC-type Fe3+-siderophore transport system, permease component [Microbacterium oleivorans]
MTAAARPGRGILGTGVVAVILVVAVIASLALGANPLAPPAVIDALAGRGTTETAFVVWDLRVPRTLVGIVAGAALGAAGALMQAFTRNPLADPGLLGVGAGAAFAVALAVALFGLSGAGEIIWPAFAGALVVTLAVYVIGASGTGGAVRLILAGVALGAVLSGVTTAITLTDPEAFDRMRGWNAGSLLGAGLDDLAAIGPFVAAGVLVAFTLANGLNAIALGDDVARSQGVDVGRIRIGVVVAVTLLAGAATAIAGPISFVGLMIPHVVKWIVGPDQRVVLPVSLLAGPVVVLAADVLGRLLIAPAEVPVGIVVAFIGAPLLIALARRRTAKAR